MLFLIHCHSHPYIDLSYRTVEGTRTHTLNNLEDVLVQTAQAVLFGRADCFVAQGQTDMRSISALYTKQSRGECRVAEVSQGFCILGASKTALELSSS